MVSFGPNSGKGSLCKTESGIACACSVEVPNKLRQRISIDNMLPDGFMGDVKIQIVPKLLYKLDNQSNPFSCKGFVKIQTCLAYNSLIRRNILITKPKIMITVPIQTRLIMGN